MPFSAGLNGLSIIASYHRRFTGEVMIVFFFNVHYIVVCMICDGDGGGARVVSLYAFHVLLTFICTF